MSTITKELAKLFRKITNSEIDAEGNAHVVLSPADSLLINNARIALASIEAEPYGYVHKAAYEKTGSCGLSNDREAYRDSSTHVAVYTVPPAPVSAPDALTDDIDSDDHPLLWSYNKGWNACRAAMLQGADGTLTNEGTIPVTQFKPVADLYGLTSPTGGETSFTFDAVEARDFIDGGWSCQEYVELERFQEAITNHTEDKLAMVDHSGDSNNMVEPVTTACELRDAVDAIRNSGIAIDGEKILAERDALNSPVIPDGWVLVPIEPTEHMIVEGFESEPDEFFSDEEVWEAYDAMSGCQQAAHRAKLCWAAMIKAAPKLE